MNLVKRITLDILTLATLSGIPSCSEKSTTSVEGKNGRPNVQLKYMVFKTLCEGHGFVLSVGIFDESTRQRVEYGNTLSHGGYCSTKLDINKSYRIEFYTYVRNQKKCIGWIKNFRYQEYPHFWSDNCDAGYSGNAYMLYSWGSCSIFDDVTDCWGQ